MHPWAKFRRAVNLTQAELGSIIGVERLSIIRYEQGMFGHLSDELIDSISEIFKVDKDLLIMEYRGYQREHRLEFAATHSKWAITLLGYQGLTHPLIYYRMAEGLSRNQLCKGLCLDYGPISAYEANKQRAVPEIIKIASDDVHWDWTYLEGAVSEWRSSGRSSIK